MFAARVLTIFSHCLHNYHAATIVVAAKILHLCHLNERVFVFLLFTKTYLVCQFLSEGRKKDTQAMLPLHHVGKPMTSPLITHCFTSFKRYPITHYFTSLAPGFWAHVWRHHESFWSKTFFLMMPFSIKPRMSTAPYAHGTMLIDCCYCIFDCEKMQTYLCWNVVLVKAAYIFMLLDLVHCRYIHCLIL